MNRALAEFERSLTSDAGLPGRSWYRHFVYAPGAYTGYGVKTLPAVREALEQRRWDDVNPNAEATAKVIARAAEHVQSATSCSRRPRREPRRDRAAEHVPTIPLRLSLSAALVFVRSPPSLQRRSCASESTSKLSASV